MNNTDQMRVLVSTFTSQIPILLVCAVALVVIFTRWKQASRASFWAFMGFGLTMILCFAIPVVQTAAQNLMMQGGESIASRANILAGLAIFWSVLRAVSYTFLLVAVFAGRSVSQPPTPTH